MTRQGWFVPCFSHGKDDQLQGELSELQKLIGKSFKPIYTLSLATSSILAGNFCTFISMKRIICYAGKEWF